MESGPRGLFDRLRPKYLNETEKATLAKDAWNSQDGLTIHRGSTP